MSVNAYQAYKKTQVSTASQGELIVMMFDGAIRFANQGKEAIVQKDLSGSNSKLIRAQEIINELISALKMEAGQIAENLHQLYTFIYDRLVEANVKKDPQLVEQAVSLLTELRDTWRQVVSNKH